MSLQQLAVEQDARADTKAIRSYTSRAWTIRAVWFAWLAMLTGLLAAGIPLMMAQRQTICDGAACAEWQISRVTAQALAEAAIPVSFYAAWNTFLPLLITVSIPVLMTVFIWHKPDDRSALVLAISVAACSANASDALSPLAMAYPFLAFPIALMHYTAANGFWLIGFLLPDGRFVPRWTRWLALVVGIVHLPILSPDLMAPGTPTRAMIDLMWNVGFFAIVACQSNRYRIADAMQRKQIRWIIYSAIPPMLAFTGLALVQSFYPVVRQPGTAAQMIWVALRTFAVLLSLLFFAAGLLRDHLLGIDVLVNRTLVYTSLTAITIALYVAIVGALGTTLHASGNPVALFLATGVVAVLFQPLHEHLQRGVNRLMYGERDEPYAVLSRLGQRLEATLAPDAIPPAIVQTVAQALRLPYAAIALKNPDRDILTIAAFFGNPTLESIHLPLSFQGETVGQLILSPRAPGESFTPADHRLLDDLGRQAGVAVHAVQLTAALQASRERLVTAREEERRRLRRDLHDGLGPALAAQTLKVGSARVLFSRDPAAADKLLGELERDIDSAIADIRRLVYDLRPPALDELGLIGAIRESAVRFTANLQITVDAPERLPPLSAAVEVAAFRIVQEALTNVVRHSGAQHCRIRVSLNGVLQVLVIDDGIGWSPEKRAGVGLASMRERAEELGGHCMVEPVTEGGTRVSVRFPLKMELWMPSRS